MGDIFFIDDEDKKQKKEGQGEKNKNKNGRKKKKIIKQKTVKENRMYSEINLQTKLDTIHITLRHHHLRLINTDKFITKIYGNDKKEDMDDNDSDSEKKEEDI